MRPLLPLARWLLDLPPPRVRSEVQATEWLPLSDGVRLATTLVRPTGAGSPRLPAVLIRTPLRARSLLSLLFARSLADAGYCVVVQECRGRYGSEGHFVPFAAEARDGHETVEWIAEQSWCDGRLALVGFGYAGFAAWAALSRAADRVGALVVAFAGREPYAALHPGGAFALANGLRWGVGVGDGELVPERRLDLARGLAFRPVREADRVTLRRVEWFREWVDHPVRDSFWRALEPAVPASPPPALLISGWFDPCLGPQLDDFAALEAAARNGGGAAPELVVGPWLPGRPLRREKRPRTPGALGATIAETIAFLDRHLRGEGDAPSRVRFYAGGEGRWREAEGWPPPGASARLFYLHSGGRANGLAGDGRLSEEAPGNGQPTDRFSYDPADPVPTHGGSLLGRGCGRADQRAVEARDDVLCYTSEPLAADVDLAGPVRAVIYAATSTPDTDFTAKLVDVAPGGLALNLCDGLVRCRWRAGGEAPQWLEPDAVQRLEIDLWAASWRFRAGHQIRLEVSSSNFPRFDRNPNTRAEPGAAAAGDATPAAQTLFHDAERASHVILPLTPTDPR
ncbi:MAG: CocE/NonD family hydrolase [Myxococcota bacterium]